jgi:hypothetical protein
MVSVALACLAWVLSPPVWATTKTRKMKTKTHAFDGVDG